MAALTGHCAPKTGPARSQTPCPPRCCSEAAAAATTGRVSLLGAAPLCCLLQRSLSERFSPPNRVHGRSPKRRPDGGLHRHGCYAGTDNMRRRKALVTITKAGNAGRGRADRDKGGASCASSRGQKRCFRMNNAPCAESFRVRGWPPCPERRAAPWTRTALGLPHQKEDAAQQEACSLIVQDANHSRPKCKRLSPLDGCSRMHVFASQDICYLKIENTG